MVPAGGRFCGTQDPLRGDEGIIIICVGLNRECTENAVGLCCRGCHPTSDIGANKDAE
jgi:hypothetical protein